jgi:glycosyltransferase involved in cell wall biosynthesis
LLFVGRIAAAKGVKEAITYALKAGHGLDIVGKVRASEQEYWNEISPYIDGEQIAYLGAKPHDEVVGYMQNAPAVLFPSQQPEAFGLVTIEAQACGTPVIISAVGASDELVTHGKTGFIARSQEDFVSAIANVSNLRRTDCRQNAERFDTEIMNRAYIELYERLRSDRL